MVHSLQYINFINSQKHGYLDKISDSWFKKNQWKEKYGVLTNIGLLLYDDPTKEPNRLIPIIDTKI